MVAEPGHWTERGRAASVASSGATGRPRRSILSLGRKHVIAMRFSIFYVCGACAISLTGCIAVPLPHYTRACPHVSGRVVDGADKPVEGAIVELIAAEGGARTYSWSGDARPGPTAKTGADGRFDIGTQFNLHVLWYATVSWQGHWPFGNYWDHEVEVRRQGFNTIRFRGIDSWDGQYCVRFYDTHLVQTRGD